MSTSDSIIERSRFGEKFIKPLYDSYCFSNIPATIQSLLGVTKNAGLPGDVLPSGKYKEYKKVVFLFIDAFGWKFFEKYKNKYPFLQRFIDKGVVSKITAQFPSTTAAEVTTMNTGLPVGESGVYEWFYYEPKLDAVIAPLLFSYAKDDKRGTLAQTGIDSAKLYPSETLYEKLNNQGVKSDLFLSSEFANSEYNLVVSRGANMHPFGSVAEALTNLSEILVKEMERTYLYFYYGKIDTMGHKHGTDSRYFESEVDLLFTAFERIFMKFIEGKVKDTIILLSADHGQTNVNPKTTFYLNREIKDISKYLKTTKKGEVIVPVGSCRDMFLHVKENFLDELSKILNQKLKGKVEIYKVEELIKDGFFGRNISKEFTERVGNLVILPYAGESVWWYEEGVFEQKHIGHHGGLTPEEMEIPFLALPM
jgi:predicted AlkP superfamily pyrophosphatase or phosphodiesterase